MRHPTVRFRAWRRLNFSPAGYDSVAALRRHPRRKARVDLMGLLIFLLVVFLIALVAGFGWRAGTRRRL